MGSYFNYVDKTSDIKFFQLYIHQKSNFYTISFLFSDSSRDEDEGIENDVEKNLIIRSELCKRVLQVCARHLAVEAEAQTHYKAVCCALVSESLELSKFMEKVKRHETESDCKELQVNLKKNVINMYLEKLEPKYVEFLPCSNAYFFLKSDRKPMRGKFRPSTIISTNQKTALKFHLVNNIIMIG